jgi:hypothetical protein
MTFHDYLLQNLSSTVMISLAVDNNQPLQYNYWNWFHQTSEFHLLKDDYTIGHIIHTGSVSTNEDGSITHTSKYHPKNVIMNFYFGQATP